MAKQQGPPLDEIQFRRPEVLEYWKGVHADSVHGYIRESPFFDHTSKNGLLWGQAWDNARVFELCANRQAFEARLRAMQGLEYMIVGEPQVSSDPALGPDTGIWVVRKQDRIKRAGREDEVKILGTYYIVGENMYQAPSVYDIVGNHLLAAMTSLSKFMEQGSPLPRITPSKGYSYLPSTTTSQAAGRSQSFSREGSVAPKTQGSDAMELDTRASSVPRSTQITTQPAAADPRDTMTLEQSFRLALFHGDEFMDENPLKGEPGSFTFAHTKEHLRSKQAEREAVAAKAKEREEREVEMRSKSGTPAAFASTSERIKAELPSTDMKQPVIRKSSKAEGKRRRKSKSAISPIEQSMTSSPATRSPVSIT